MSRSQSVFASAAFALAAPAAAGEAKLAPLAEESVIEVLTHDASGALRETKVWVVVVDGSPYVRTNASRWLANIRRGSQVALRVRAVASGVSAEEVDDPAVAERVEEAFKAKYGFVQRVMSFFRISDPTVLRLAFIDA